MKKPLFFLLWAGKSLHLRTASDARSGRCSPVARQEGGAGGVGEKSLWSTDPSGFNWVGEEKTKEKKDIMPTNPSQKTLPSPTTLSLTQQGSAPPWLQIQLGSFW